MLIAYEVTNPNTAGPMQSVGWLTMHFLTSFCAIAKGRLCARCCNEVRGSMSNCLHSARVSSTKIAGQMVVKDMAETWLGYGIRGRGWGLLSM